MYDLYQSRKCYFEIFENENLPQFWADMRISGKKFYSIGGGQGTRK